MVFESKVALGSPDETSSSMIDDVHRGMCVGLQRTSFNLFSTYFNRSGRGSLIVQCYNLRLFRASHTL